MKSEHGNDVHELPDRLRDESKLDSFKEMMERVRSVESPRPANEPVKTTWKTAQRAAIGSEPL